MNEPTKPEPSEGARRAAEALMQAYENELLRYAWKRIDKSTREARLKDMARFIDRETHSAEMRKALENAFGWIGFFARCMDRGESLSAEDERGLSALVGEIRAALKGGAL